MNATKRQRKSPSKLAKMDVDGTVVHNVVEYLLKQHRMRKFETLITTLIRLEDDEEGLWRFDE